MSWPRRPAPGTPDGERAWKRGIEKQIKDLQKIRNPPPPPTPPPASGGTIPFLVAAADAPDEWKAVAAFQCDQTDDAPTIQAAVDVAAGTTVTLSPGNFYLPTTAVELGWENNLEGIGAGSIIWGPAGAAVIPGTRSVIRRLAFNPYGTAGIGVDADTNNGTFTVEQCWFNDLETSVHLRSANGAQVRDCDLADSRIEDTNALRCRIESCHFWAFGSRDAVALSGSNTLLADCQFVDGTLVIGGVENLVTGSQMTANVLVEIGGSANAFASNYVQLGASSYTDTGTGTQKPTNGNFSSGGLW